MRILLTGSDGLIGTALTALLRAEGEDVVPFDLVRGDDVLRVNLQGTANVLAAVRAADVSRVVFASSANALGVFRGEGRPDYLPLDDDHPCRPRSPYGIAKLRAEDLCARLTEETGTRTICLRPPGVWTEHTYARIQAARDADPAYEWSPWWEYGAFLDLRDCASAFVRAVHCEVPGHARLLLCAADVSTSGPTAPQLAARLLPDVPLRDAEGFRADPYRALVETRRARRLLQWTPEHASRGWIRARGARPGIRGSRRPPG